MEKIKVGVIYGGRSGEHEISVRSAKTVIEQIDKDKYEVTPIAISREGNWLNPQESLKLFTVETQQLLPENTANFSDSPVALIGDTRYQGLAKLQIAEGEERLSKLDVIFPVLHGTYGEDGTLQGLLEMADIPYVGCGVLASSCGMDKIVMKTLFRDAGLPIWARRSVCRAPIMKSLCARRSSLPPDMIAK